MKCLQCGTPMTTARENVPYHDCGLPDVALHDVEVRRCPNCGEYEVVIPAIDELHRLIAATVVQKQTRLAPEEIRYLRKYLGWSSTDFSEQMGVKLESVSRWEHGRLRMTAPAERLLRLRVATKDPIRNYSPDDLRRITREETPPIRIDVRAKGGRWEPCFSG